MSKILLILTFINNYSIVNNTGYDEDNIKDDNKYNNILYGDFVDRLLPNSDKVIIMILN